jgi:hypothetical protein
MKTITVTAALFTAALAIGCSSTESKDPVPAPGTTTPGTPAPTATTGDTTPPDTTTTTPPATPVAPKAPQIATVAKMMGALHVMWTNPTTACDTIEGERQAKMPDGTIMEKYKVVFTLPGEANNKHDTTATDAMTYTYRLRCKTGTLYSVYSNEMSGTP